MSGQAKSIHVRLCADAYAALGALAGKRRMATVASDLIADCLYGRARGERASAERRPGGYVYVLRVGDLYKIGRSRNPTKRITGMSLPGKPEIIFLRAFVDCVAAERGLHKLHQQYRSHGEWFKLPPHVVSEFRGRGSVR